MNELNCSDLHLKAGMRPRFRQNGILEEGTEFPELTRDDIEQLLAELLTEEQLEHYRSASELDFSYGSSEHGRFRCNCFGHK